MTMAFNLHIGRIQSSRPWPLASLAACTAQKPDRPPHRHRRRQKRAVADRCPMRASSAFAPNPVPRLKPASPDGHFVWNPGRHHCGAAPALFRRDRLHLAVGGHFVEERPYQGPVWTSWRLEQRELASGAGRRAPRRWRSRHFPPLVESKGSGASPKREERWLSATSIAPLHARALAQIEGFWAEQAQAIDWTKRWDKVLDASKPPVLSLVRRRRAQYLLQRARPPRRGGRADQAALIYDSPVTGTSERFTYRELRDEVARFAGALRGAGRRAGRPGDRLHADDPEAVIGDAGLRPARRGALGGVRRFRAPNELATRIDDATPRLIV